MNNTGDTASDAPSRTGTATAPRHLDRDLPAVSPLPLMQLSIGFWSFKALATAYELDLFSQLSGTDGCTTDELAATLGIARRPPSCCSPRARRSACSSARTGAT